MADCLDGIDAIPAKGYEVIYYGEAVNIPYPSNANTTKDKRPEGRSFHHGRFIQRLRQKAMLAKNVLVVESSVTDLVTNGWTGQILGVKSITRGEQDYVSPCSLLQGGSETADAASTSGI